MKWINIILGLIFLVSLVSAQEASMYIEIDNNFEVLDIGLVEGESSNFDFENVEYIAQVNSLSGEKFEVPFSFPTFAYVDDYDNLEVLPTVELDESSELLFFPYYNGVDKLNVYDKEENLVFTYDLSEYRVCDYNGVCLGSENQLNCPEDCLEERNVLDIEEELNVFEKEIVISEDKTKSYVLIIVAIVALILLLVLYMKRKK